MKKIIFLMITVLILGITLVIYLSKREIINNDKEMITTKSIIKEEKILDDKDKKEKIEEEIELTQAATKEEYNKIELKDNKTKTTTVKKEQNTSNVTTQKKEVTKQVEQTQVVNTTKKSTTESTRKEQPWEKLGVSEEQYYNKPVYSWEHVDFSVEKYGNKQQAKEACLNHGDNYEPYLNGEELYHCSTVYSLSGKYLGEMFHTEKLNH